MIRKNVIKSGLLLILLISISITGTAAFYFGTEIETGFAWSGYNDIRIPGEGGTDFSFSEELKSEEITPTRIRFIFKVGEKSSLILLYAPLKLEAHGTLDRDLIFFEETFPAGTELDGTYKFNSYRITYVYDWKQGSKFNLSFGLRG